MVASIAVIGEAFGFSLATGYPLGKGMQRLTGLLQAVRPCEVDFCDHYTNLASFPEHCPAARAPSTASTEPASGLVPSGNDRQCLRPPGADAVAASKVVCRNVHQWNDGDARPFDRLVAARVNDFRTVLLTRAGPRGWQNCFAASGRESTRPS
ncbi:MAG: hypothetical protein OXL68_12960, partial [Paracoccaceae bacterium]|nr:hypothetical protein [Paracoccaceae bacterium]